MTFKDCVVGVDCSTTAAKAVVWDADGNALSSARFPYGMSEPQPGWGEQNAEDWATAALQAIRRAVQTVEQSRVGAICVTHQRETFVCLDSGGHPLRPAMLWLDARAAAQVERVRNRGGPRDDRQAAERDAGLVQAVVARRERAGVAAAYQDGHRCPRLPRPPAHR